MFLHALYWVSLMVVIVAAAIIALHPEIPGGWLGTLSLGGVAIFGISLFDRPAPDDVGQTLFMICLAWVCVWACLRWRIEITRADKCGCYGGTD